MKNKFFPGTILNKDCVQEIGGNLHYKIHFAKNSCDFSLIKRGRTKNERKATWAIGGQNSAHLVFSGIMVWLVC